MKFTKRHAFLALVPGVILSATLPADRMVFAPEEGSELTMSFSTELDMVLDDFSLVVDGQDIGQMIGTPDFELTTSTAVAIVDEFERMSSERPNSILRTIDEASLETDVSVSMMGQGEDQNISQSAELEGRQVRFTWDEDAGEYVARFAEDEDSEDELLDGLIADMSMRGFLPPGDVEVGDSWEIPAEVLGNLALPGGDLGWTPDGVDGMDDDAMAEMEAMMEPIIEEMMSKFEDMYAGAVTATYNGDREVDGVELAEIGLTFAIDGSLDLTSMIEDVIESVTASQDEMPEDFTFDIEEAIVTFEGEGEGLVLWNRSTNVISSLEAEIDAVIGMEFAATGGAEGETASVEASMEMSGTVANSLEAN